MRMLKPLLIIAVILLGTALISAQKEMSVHPPVAVRYWIIQAQYRVAAIGTDRSRLETGLFKLDTETGQTWIFVKRGMREGRWEEIETK